VGRTLILRPDPPAVADAAVPGLTETTTWSDVEGLFRALGDVGCGWANLRFSLGPDGEAVVGYEAKPDGKPLPGRGIPAANGGFDP